jgi:phage terminase large subunit-like protein
VAKRIRSPRRRPLQSDLSPEVRWYLESRGYEIPTIQPRVRTPEPRDEPGAVFDPARVDRKIKALGKLKHTKGKWAGDPIIPTNVQVAFIIAPIFGWVHPDDDGHLVRIIRDAYIEMPRKGAKTTLVSGLAMVLGFADDEPGAEVLLGAASRDQAGQAYKPLEALARSSKMLARAGIKATKKEIVRASDGSLVKAVSSRGDLAHGANVHAGLVDELHVHKSPDLLEAIESGTGARTQPLVFIITTADDGQTITVYAVRRSMIEKIAAGVLKVPSMYGVVFAADDKDDPHSPVTWAKANPLYPVTPSPQFMRAHSDKAKAGPVELASFQRLHLGIRAKQDQQFIDLVRWDRNAGTPIDEADLAGRASFGGLDLGSTSDLCALLWLFPDEERGGYDLLHRFWMPEAALDRLDTRTQRNATAWVELGMITLTPGEVTDQDFIEAQIRKDLDTFTVHAIGFDPWNATQLTNNLTKDEAPMVTVRQGFVSMNSPLKECQRLVLKGTKPKPLLRHGGHPVMRWMTDNLRVATDPAGNVKPDKARSMDKIDGWSALVTGMAVAMTAEAPKDSVYEKRDVLVL